MSEVQTWIGEPEQEAMGSVGETWVALGSPGRGTGRTEAAGRRGSRARKVTRHHLVHAKRRAGGPWEVSRMASLASSSVPSQEGGRGLLGLPMIECQVGPQRDGGVVLPVAEVSCEAPDQARDHPQCQLAANLMIACDAASFAAAQGFAAPGLEVELEAPAEREFAAVVELRILEVGHPDAQEGKGEVLEAFQEGQVACPEILEDPFVVQLILGLLKKEHRANSPQDPQH